MDNYYTLPCQSNFYRQALTQPGSQYQPGNAMGAPSSQMMPLFPSAPIGTTLPTGLPSGTNMAPPPSFAGASTGELTPQSVQNTNFLPGFLRTQIGRRVLVVFLIGSTGTTDRSGTLLGVGASYILLRPDNTDDVILCDLYSIKFVTIYH
jgi:hypothetical protein